MRGGCGSSAFVRLSVTIGVLVVAWSAFPAGQGRRPSRRIEVIDGREAVAGEAIVRYKAGVRAGRQALAQALDADESALGHGARRIRSRSANVRQLIAALAGRGDIESVEPNYIVRATRTPNDPLFIREPGLWNQTRPGIDVHASAAWDLTVGSNATVVALIDSGVDYRHPDLQANIWTAPEPFTVTFSGVDVTCPAGTHGFNVLLGSCDPMDDFGHGTAMAGVIGASGDNGIGISGINWRASVMPVKFLGSDGFGTYADAINAMEFALQVKEFFAAKDAANVRVLSNSWSGAGTSQALQEEIMRAASRDVLFVASAGNDASNNDAVPKYPASFTAPNIVAVAATTATDELEGYSNYGASSVDLGAPAAMHSTALAGGYADTGGTSASTAMVSGAAALILSHCRLSMPALRSLLLSTVDPAAALSGVTVTGGRLNVERAIEGCRGSNTAPQIALTSPRTGQVLAAPATIAIAADALDFDGTVASVAFYSGATWIGRDTTAPFGMTWSVATPGSYALTAVATDDDGATIASTTVTVTVSSPVSSLPAPWKTQDVGNTGIAGDAVLSGGTFVLTGGGADIWSASDQFRYVYQPLAGDGEIIARVSYVANVDPWTKAGVMIRESLTASSPHALMLVSAGKGLAFQRRTAVGGLSANTSGGMGAAPTWVRLRRQGQTITASASTDGSTWTLVGSDTFTMPSTVYVGLALSSHRTGVAATATVDSVQVATGSGAVLPAGWSSIDIGSVGAAGRASASGSAFTVTGAGADVWGGVDALHFAYATLPGDGEIVARVKSLEAVAPWTKAGVMIRASLAANAAHAFMLVSPGKGRAFQRRPLTAAALSVHTAGGAGTAPVWVRLVRRGQIVTALLSADGVTWTTVGEDTVALGATAYAGLAVSSHVIGTTATGVFDQVAILN